MTGPSVVIASPIRPMWSCRGLVASISRAGEDPTTEESPRVPAARPGRQGPRRPRRTRRHRRCRRRGRRRHPIVASEVTSEPAPETAVVTETDTPVPDVPDVADLAEWLRAQADAEQASRIAAETQAAAEAEARAAAAAAEQAAADTNTPRNFNRGSAAPVRPLLRSPCRSRREASRSLGGRRATCRRSSSCPGMGWSPAPSRTPTATPCSQGRVAARSLCLAGDPSRPGDQRAARQPSGCRAARPWRRDGHGEPVPDDGPGWPFAGTARPVTSASSARARHV
jgi:hypothetical protein